MIRTATHFWARAFGAGLFALILLASAAKATEVQRVISPGGIEAWLVEDHNNPIITVDFAFRGGAALDPEGKAGLANMASALLDEGAGEMDSLSFRRRMENLSIRLSFSAGRDQFSGNLKTLTENSETAFELLRLALTEPRFDAEPVERIRSQILAGLKRSSTDPDAIVGRTIRRLWFGDHPYARDREGRMETVRAIETADLRAFVKERLALDTLYIGVVGDIDAERLATLLDQTFGALPAEAAPFAVAEVEAGAKGETVVVEQDVPQSVVRLGHDGIKRDDPDYYAAYVVNYILGGGGFSSRLFEEVREKRGLAYSVYSYLWPMDHAGVVLGGVATANARVGQSLDLIRAEWKRMAEEGPTAEELEHAKTYLTGSFPLRFSNSGAIAGMLVGMQMEDLGIDYIDTRNSYIEAVTLEQARRVAAELYKPGALTVVVVGKPEGIEATRPAPDDPQG